MKTPQSDKLQKLKEVEDKLVGKNIHSVFTLCLECRLWGINMPKGNRCGNCNSLDTLKYYDIETVSQALDSYADEVQRETLEEAINIVEWELTPHGYESDDRSYEKFACELKEKLSKNIKAKLQSGKKI